MRCTKFFLPVVLALAMIFLARAGFGGSHDRYSRAARTNHLQRSRTHPRVPRHSAQRQRNCSGETFGKELEGLPD